MAYRAPVEDIIFSLKHAAGFAKARADRLYQDIGDDDLDVVLGEAGRFASEVQYISIKPIVFPKSLNKATQLPPAELGV
jgi:hypothetical protein